MKNSEQDEARTPADTEGAKPAGLEGNLLGQIGEMKLQISDLQSQLADARRKPSGVLGDLIAYKALSRLSRNGLFPAKMRARFRRSADKRNPMRSVAEAAALTDEDAASSGHSFRRIKSGAAQEADPDKSTVMVVSHEASRTGAPILALNIARKLAEKYNVVVVIMGPGELRDAFKAVAIAMYDLTQRSRGKVSAAMNDICTAHDLRYAVVNSVESRTVLPGLKAAGVPTVALLHEFASSIRPANVFSDVFRDADKIVFSTRMTLENALEQYGLGRGAAFHVIPQGKCVVPGGTLDHSERDIEQRWLDSVLRPNAEASGEFVVLGAGTIETRKAVDLFLECATRVISGPGGGRFRFVWIGRGYNPEKDVRISNYLADQIRRAGIQSQVSIVRPTSEIEYAYRAADALLLSSRLDPLPNVAIDALVAGTPVLCFERTTGIADFLLESGLGETCVAQYLDTGDMAQKIATLADDETRLAEVASRGREAAARRFDLDRYIDTIDALAVKTVPAAQQVAEDAEFLVASGRFRPDFFCRPGEDADDVADAVRRYLESSTSGERMRKPAPGFHPGVYAAHHEQESGGDPFVRFLRDGAPAGDWSLDVIDDQSAVTHMSVTGMRVALHLHVTRPEALVEIDARLRRNEVRPDLFITTTAERQAPVTAALADLSLNVVAVDTVPDRGGHVGAFLTGFGAKLARDYDVTGHIHADVAEEPSTGSRAFLLENLIGGETGGAMLDRILAAMSGEAGPSLVYPDDPGIVNWGDSRAASERLARRLGFRRLPDQINYPTSGMFWMRTDLLSRFLTLDLGWADYPAGRSAAADTVVDALPRVFGVIPKLENMQTAVTNVRGVTR